MHTYGHWVLAKPQFRFSNTPVLAATVMSVCVFSFLSHFWYFIVSWCNSLLSCLCFQVSALPSLPCDYLILLCHTWVLLSSLPCCLYTVYSHTALPHVQCQLVMSTCSTSLCQATVFTRLILDLPVTSPYFWTSDNDWTHFALLPESNVDRSLNSAQIKTACLWHRCQLIKDRCLIQDHHILPADSVPHILNTHNSQNVRDIWLYG